MKPLRENGYTWENAYLTLTDALAHANQDARVYEIRIAGGTYYPGDNPNAYFSMINNVTIAGGYAGSNDVNNPDRRNTVDFETILSGDLDEDEIICFGDSYHVFLNSGNTIDETAILSGVTIKGGYARSDLFYDPKSKPWGGGMYNYYCSPTVVNCKFISNKAADQYKGYGGGMCNYEASPAVVNCVFKDNIARTAGGAVYNYCLNSRTPKFINCTFISNELTACNSLGGAGMYDHGAGTNTIVTNCVFWVNTTCDFFYYSLS